MEHYRNRGKGDARDSTHKKIQIFFLQRSDKHEEILEKGEVPWAKRVLDRLRSWWTRIDYDGHVLDFLHVELMFEDLYVTGVTDKRGCFFVKNKNPNREGYSCLTMYLEPQKYKRMRRKAKAMGERNIPAASDWYALGFVPVCGACFPNTGEKALFCSQYVVMLFQEIGLLMDLEPGKISPTELYVEIEETCVTYSLMSMKSEQELVINDEGKDDDDIIRAMVMHR